MPAEGFYREPDPLVSQGDIVRGVPHLHLKPPLVVLRQRQTRRGFVMDPYEYGTGAEVAEGRNTPVPTGGFNFDRGLDDKVSVFCQVALGIILSRDCDIENDRKHRLVALIRPLTGVQPEHQEIIRANKNFSFFHLPELQNKMPESYVDFRRITTLAPDFVDGQDRLASLTGDARNSLYEQLMAFWTEHETA
jgi:hypothetical protein